MCCLSDALLKRVACGHHCEAGWSRDRLSERLMDDCYGYYSSNAGSAGAGKLGTGCLRSLLMLQMLSQIAHLSSSYRFSTSFY